MNLRKIAAGILCLTLAFSTFAEPLAVMASEGVVQEENTVNEDIAGEALEDTGSELKDAGNTSEETGEELENTGDNIEKQETAGEDTALTTEEEENTESSDSEAAENTDISDQEAASAEIETVETEIILDPDGVDAPNNLFTVDGSGKLTIDTAVYSGDPRSLTYATYYIPEGCAIIPAGIFTGNTSVEKISFQGTSSLSTIENNAFKGCTKLKTFEQSNVGVIGESAFEGCSELVQISVPAVHTISKKAFYDCGKMSAFNNINRTVYILGESAFENCSMLNSIDFLSDSTSEIPDKAFYQTGLRSISFSATMNLTKIGKSAFEKCEKAYGDITIPSTCVTIDDGAFLGCTDITGIKITGITNATVTIGEKAFDGCTNIKNATFEELSTNPVVSRLIIGTKAFYACSKLNTVTIKMHDLEIGANAFSACALLKTVTISSKINTDKTNTVSIDDKAFSATAALDTVNITAREIRVRANGFSGCGGNGTAKIKFTCDKATIDSKGFENAAGLKTFTIETYDPSAIDGYVNIRSEAFSGANKLAEINITSLNITVGDSGFYSCKELKTVTMTSKVGNNLGSINLGPKAFYGCLVLGSGEYKSNPVFSGNNVTIGEEAFYNCAKLKQVTVNANTDAVVRKKAFYKVDTLTSFIADKFNSDTPATIRIGESAFEDCTKLEKIDFVHSSDENRIGPSAFKGCTNMTSVKLPERFAYIGESAFENCRKLSSVVLPLLVSSNPAGKRPNNTIPENMFNDCIALKTVSFGTNKSLYECTIETIDKYAFAGTTALTSISLPKTVKNIKQNAFTGGGLKSVTINYGEETKYSGPDEEPGMKMNISSEAFPNIKTDFTIRGYDGYVKTFANRMEYNFESLNAVRKVLLASNLQSVVKMTYKPENPRYGDKVYVTFEQTSKDTFLYDLSTPVGLSEKPVLYSCAKNSPTYVFVMKDSDVTISGVTYSKNEMLNDAGVKYNITTTGNAVDSDNTVTCAKAGEKFGFKIVGKMVIPEWLWDYKSSDDNYVSVEPDGTVTARQVTPAQTITATSLIDSKITVSFKVAVVDNSIIRKIEFVDLDNGVKTSDGKYYPNAELKSIGALHITSVKYLQNQYIDEKNPDIDLREKSPEVDYPIITFRKTAFSNSDESFNVYINTFESKKDTSPDKNRYVKTEWSIVNSDIATLDAKTKYNNQNKVTIKKGKSGEFAITVKTTNLDDFGSVVENKLLVRVVDTTPKIMKDSFTVNSESTEGYVLSIYENYDDAIDTNVPLRIVKDKGKGVYEDVLVDGGMFSTDFKSVGSVYEVRINASNAKNQTIKDKKGLYIMGTFSTKSVVGSNVFLIPISSITIKKGHPNPKFTKTGYINTFYNGNSYDYYKSYYYNPDTKTGYFAELEDEKLIKSAEAYYTSNFYNYTAGQVLFKQNIDDKISHIELMSIDRFNGKESIDKDQFNKLYTIVETDSAGDYDQNNYDGKSFTLRLSEGYKDLKDDETGKNILSGYIIITYDGFEAFPVKMKVSIPNKKSSPTYKLTPSSTKMYQEVTNAVFVLQLLDKFKKPLYLRNDTSLTNERTININDAKSVGTWINPVIAGIGSDRFSVQYNGSLLYSPSMTKAVIGVTQPTWSSWVNYTFTLKKQTGKIAPSFAATSIRYNKNNLLDVATEIKLTQGGIAFDIDNFDETVVEHNYGDTSIAETIMKAMSFECKVDDDGTQGCTIINIIIADNNNKLADVPSGTYKYKFIPKIVDNQGNAISKDSIKPINFKVVVEDKRVSVKLKTTTLKFNYLYGSDETSSSLITLSGLPKNAVVEGFNEHASAAVDGSIYEPMVKRPSKAPDLIYSGNGVFESDDDDVPIIIEFGLTDDEEMKPFVKAYLAGDCKKAFSYGYTIKNLCAKVGTRDVLLKDFKVTVKCMYKSASVKWSVSGKLNPVQRNDEITLKAKISNTSQDTVIVPDQGEIEIYEIDDEEGSSWKPSNRFDIKQALDKNNKPIANTFKISLNDGFEDADFERLKGSKKYNIMIGFRLSSDSETQMTQKPLKFQVKQVMPNLTGKFMTYYPSLPFGTVVSPEGSYYLKSAVNNYYKANTVTSQSIYAGTSEDSRTFRIYVKNPKAITGCTMEEIRLDRRTKSNSEETLKAFTVTDFVTVPIVDDNDPSKGYNEYYVDVTCNNPALLKMNKSIPLKFETRWAGQVEKTTGPVFTVNLTVKK